METPLICKVAVINPKEPLKRLETIKIELKKENTQRSIKHVPTKWAVKWSPTETQHTIKCGFVGLSRIPRKYVLEINSPETMDWLGVGQI